MAELLKQAASCRVEGGMLSVRWMHRDNAPSTAPGQQQTTGNGIGDSGVQMQSLIGKYEIP